MKSIRYRVDDETYQKMCNYDLDFSEISRRIARKIKKGIVYSESPRKGLNKIISADLTDSLADVSTTKIRDGVIHFFKHARPMPKLDIEAEVEYLNKLRSGEYLVASGQ